MGLFDSQQSQSSRSGINVAPETDLEKQATGTLASGLTGLEGIVNAGPGAQQAGAAVGASQQYADLLGQLGQGQGLLNAQQAGIAGYTQLGNQLYGGLMRQQQTEASRMAARQGRGMNDLMLQNKLGQQRNDLVGSFAVQQSMQAPMQQAQLMGQRADVMQGLASQAMANRQALLGMGSNLRESDRAYRINTGTRWSDTSQSSNPSGLDSLGAIVGIGGSVLKGYGQLQSMGQQSEMFAAKKDLMAQYQQSGNTAGYERLLTGGGNSGSSDYNPTPYKPISTLTGPNWSPAQGGGMTQQQYAQDINAQDPILQRYLTQQRQQQAPQMRPFLMSNFKQGSQF